MYQFSLDAYIELFSNSIDKSLKHPRLEERIQYLNDYHTYAVYQYTCRSASHTLLNLLNSTERLSAEQLV